MKKHIILSFICLLAFSNLGRAQEIDLEKEFFSLPSEVTDAFLDTLDLPARAKPNDYWLIGGYGGVALLRGYFNPTRTTQFYQQNPVWGASILRYFKMFGLFANMGAEFGFQHTFEGYSFKEYETDGVKYRQDQDGYHAAVMEVPEVFFLSHFHADFGENFKLMLKGGLFGGYRTNIRRIDPVSVETELAQSFSDHDRRLTYGVQGGFGAGIMFDPFEIHLMAQVKWGWSSFYEPDYYHPYYYRYAYPLDLGITLGLYYQLTPRRGHTRAQLRRMAREMVLNQ